LYNIGNSVKVLKEEREPETAESLYNNGDLSSK
jgi:hypothetical protein